jgi:predicted phosphodiesterase
MAVSAGLRSGDVIAFAHTHKPWTRVLDGIHFVNTGSVGRPKDGEPRAGFVIVAFDDSGEVSIQFSRVEYDVNAAVQGIEKSDLPNDFGDYLRSGGRR